MRWVLLWQGMILLYETQSQIACQLSWLVKGLVCWVTLQMIITTADFSLIKLSFWRWCTWFQGSHDIFCQLYWAVRNCDWWHSYERSVDHYGSWIVSKLKNQKTKKKKHVYNDNIGHVGSEMEEIELLTCISTLLWLRI